MEPENQQNIVVDDIDLMKEVCELLMYDSGTLEDVDQTDSTAVEWFKSWALTIQNQNDESSLLQPYLVTVLRDYLLDHAWTNSLTVLRLLGDDPSHSAISLWKVGMEIMYTSPDKNSRLLEHYVRKLKGMSDLELKEVVLEYVMYLLHQGELQEAKRAMVDIPKIRGMKKSDKSKTKYHDLVFQAYQGLLYYTRWNLDRQRLASHATEIDRDDFGQSLFYFDGEEDALKDSAERALSCFSQLYDHLGVWDIFITKHVQILEHYYRLEEAQTILEMYRDKNSENPNTHKYLYSLCMKHGLVARDCETKLLKAVADCVPSDRLVLDLCDRFIEDGSISDLLFYIFELKDYRCWQNDAGSWRILSLALQWALDSDNLEMVHQHWEHRKSWWPAYHFKDIVKGTADQGEATPESTDTVDLWLHRACCSVLLTGPENSFELRVRNMLNREQIQQLNEVVEKVVTSPGIT